MSFLAFVFVHCVQRLRQKTFGPHLTLIFEPSSGVTWGGMFERDAMALVWEEDTDLDSTGIAASCPSLELC